MENKFAERLTNLLIEKQLSKRKCAQEIGVSAMSISDWTTGKVQPTAESIYIIAQYFSVTSDYLLGLENDDGSRASSTYEFEYQHNGTKLKHKESKK